MEKFLEFLVNHWVLTGTFIVLLAWLFQTESNKVIRGIQMLTTSECVQKVNHDNGVILDIREETKFNDGYIVNAVNCPLAGLENNFKKLQKYKNKPIIVTCQNGQTCVSGAELLKKGGFEKIYALKGGIQEWVSSGLPLVKK
ncbi:MAG: rhodanese-like domain-containing protein [Legionellales bacterium]|nr:rhodanese-like domain-containing protein [Legionellales bacterium]